MKSFLLPMVLVLALSGCASSVPDCGDEKTVALVKQLVLQNLLGEDSDSLSEMFNVEVNAIQTLSHSQEPERYECKAGIVVRAAGKLEKFLSDYKVGIPGMFGKNESGAPMTESEVQEKIVKFENVKRRINSNAQLQELPRYIGAATLGAINQEFSIEFNSTSAQQDGAIQHYIEMSPVWREPNRLLALVAKAAKFYDLTPPVKESKPTQSVEPAQSKLSPAAEEAISSGFVEIKNPDVMACTDKKIAEIRQQAGEDAVINFDAYNEVAVACGFNIP
ncbi:MAG: hypothetical protein HOP24_02800 [Sideroxydans sp.]|nr:hypothetical protein [Sideroxydans sp.]